MKDRPSIAASGAVPRPGAIPARATLAGGLVLGLAGDILLRGRGGPGLNLFLGGGLVLAGILYISLRSKAKAAPVEIRRTPY